MFKPMRKANKQISDHEVDEILFKGSYGVLATISENAYPYATPMSFVYYRNKIYLHGANEGHKLDNIRLNPNVSFSVTVDTELMPEQFNTKYRSVVLFGKARELSKEEKKDVLLQFIEKYAPSFLEKGMDYINRSHNETNIIEIHIDHITGKAEK